MVLVGFGLFSIQTFWGFNFATLPLHLNQLTGSKTLTGLLLSSSGIFGLTVPLVAGAFSDRLRTRWGKRKPLILVGWSLTILLLLVLPHLQTMGAIVPGILVMYASFYTGLAPYFAYMPDITPPEQQGTASGVMFFMGGAGNLIYLYFGAMNWDRSHEAPFALATFMIAAGAAFLLLGTREPAHPSTPERSGWIRQALGNKTVRRFYMAMVFWCSGIWIVSGFFVIAGQELFGLTTRQAIMGYFAFTASMFLFTFPMAVLSNRINPRWITAASLFGFAGCMFGVSFCQVFTTAFGFLLAGGAAFAGIITVGYRFFLTIIPARQRAGFMGGYMACQFGTMLIGPFIGGVLIDTFGVRSLFLGAGAFVLTGLIIFLNMGETDTIFT